MGVEVSVARRRAMEGTRVKGNSVASVIRVVRGRLLLLLYS